MGVSDEGRGWIAYRGTSNVQHRTSNAEVGRKLSSFVPADYLSVKRPAMVEDQTSRGC